MRTKDEIEYNARIIDRATAAAHVVMRQSIPAEDDRRDKPRFSVSLSVTLLGDHNFYVGLTENLSEGGIFVQTQQTLPIGTKLRVEFSLPTCPHDISLIGEVRWIRLPEAVCAEHDNFGSSADAKPGMGIQFTKVSAADGDAIAKFIRLRAPEFYAE